MLVWASVLGLDLGEVCAGAWQCLVHGRKLIFEPPDRTDDAESLKGKYQKQRQGRKERIHVSTHALILLANPEISLYCPN